MGGPDTFLVELEGPGIYYGGQMVQGQVHISSKECMSNIKNVQIKLIGFGEVHWTERENKTRRSSDGKRGLKASNLALLTQSTVMMVRESVLHGQCPTTRHL